MLFCLVVCSELWENCDLYLKKKSWFSIISEVRGTEMSNTITLSNWQILWLLLLLFINYLLLLIGWEIKYTAGLCYVNIPGTTCFAHSSCTSLFILIFIKSTVDCIAHFILFNCTFYSSFYFILLLIFYLTLTYIYISSLVLCIIFYFIFLHCPLSGPVLTYISLLIIPCMIVYVTNNKEPWTLNRDNNQ